ncbi:DUF2076 domain-containing protein [Aureimonas sp. ME7]|uniref:DUF2076 domain-containing protein n=1 Tax=Aureimonas sp. ME7 TaxID=2744252 RepID=UPI0015F5A1B7|nr:DUF2076 domain-containing protein [Aureimonas sp. ME7]
MDTNDRQAISGLFDKLGTVERDMPQRDAEAERFIAERIGQQPASPYYMAQTIVMQQAALENQQRELDALRADASNARAPQAGSGGGFLSRMFGGNEAPARQAPSPAYAPQAARPGSGAGPWGGAGAAAPQGGMMAGRGGGGFLAGAAQTAMGVAGGVLLGNAIGGMFGSGEAQAAETPASEPEQHEPAVDETADEGGFFDDGGGFDEI